MKKAMASILCIVCVCVALCACTPFGADAPEGISLDGRTFTKIRDERMYAEAPDYKGYIFKEGESAMCFRMKSPESVQENKSYPLIVFLHGRGDGGTDNGKHMYRSFIGAVEKYVNEECFVMLPQAFDDLDWTQTGGKKKERGMSNMYNACLDAVCAAFPIDSARIYLTGMSMGGNGTVYQAYTHPQKYAAAMALCGYYSEYISDFSQLARLPLWLAHSRGDKSVAAEESEWLYRKLTEAGSADVHLKIYEGDAHDVTPLFYDNASIWQWLLSKRFNG